jgi:hypothetical protein
MTLVTETRSRCHPMSDLSSYASVFSSRGIPALVRVYSIEALLALLLIQRNF